MPIPTIGDPAPRFTVASATNPRFHIDAVAGHLLVLCFFGSAGRDYSRALLDHVRQRRAAFDDHHAAFFGISTDSEDLRQQRLQDHLPGIRFLHDFELVASKAFGLVEANRYQPLTVILDERLRVYAHVPFTLEPARHADAIVQVLASAPPAGIVNKVQIPAPVLIIPRVFEPALCRQLIDYYEAGGATDSGFMRDIDGKTVGVYDYSHKRRSDKIIDDQQLRNACMARIHRRVAPELQRAFQFNATRIERHIVACYDSADAAHFQPHRDNTTRGTAHRRFAVSLVLNTGEFEGGEVRFPEFGRQTYSPPAGGAVVFSCSLLHEATRVTAGKRYCYLPFLYDDAAARIREQNRNPLADADADNNDIDNDNQQTD